MINKNICLVSGLVGSCKAVVSECSDNSNQVFLNFFSHFNKQCYLYRQCLRCNHAPLHVLIYHYEAL